MTLLPTSKTWSHEQLMEARRQYLTDKQVAERYGVSRETIWRWDREGKNKFPVPFKLADRTVRWRLLDLLIWEEELAG